MEALGELANNHKSKGYNESVNNLTSPVDLDKWTGKIENKTSSNH